MAFDVRPVLQRDEHPPPQKDYTHTHTGRRTCGLCVLWPVEPRLLHGAVGVFVHMRRGGSIGDTHKKKKF